MTPAPAPMLSMLAFMAGSWVSEAPGYVNEEHWTTPAGGSMIGMARTLKEGDTIGWEHLRIEAVDGQVRYLASPGGKPPVAFVLVDAGPGRARFENADHDFPQRIEYWTPDGGAGLCARISTLRSEAEGGTAMEWCWKPAPR
ncbi:MAG: hypothetical protein H6742_02960 [Alphaproteobacteria bacterium]|nr:hypothetical protein [Alphaproteobacteria bacterium]